MPISATAMRLILRQLEDLESHPADGVRVHKPESLTELLFDVAGPDDTPFAGGAFRLALLLDDGYPARPPRGVFRTKIFHPNVAEKGDVCVNVLQKDWRPSLGLRHVLAVVRCLLIAPNAESALNEAAARLLLEDYDAYRRKAAMMTRIHAMRPLPQPEGEPKESSHEEDGGSAGVATAAPGGETGSAQLRNTSELTVNKQFDVGGRTATMDIAAKKAMEKKRAALKRI